LQSAWLRYGGIAVSAACIAVGASLADWERTFRVLADADRALIALAGLLMTLTLSINAARWRQLIAAGYKVPPRQLFNVLMIGYLANAILPMRPGDLARAVLLRQLRAISLSQGLASIVVERLFDIFAICGLGIVASVLVPLPALVVSALYSFALAGIGLLTVLVLFTWRKMVIGRLVDRFSGISRRPLWRFLVEWLQRFATAVEVLYVPGRMVASALLTILAWGVLAVAMILLVRAFHLSVPPAAALLVLVTTGLGAAIPASPGSLGVYHFMAILALSAWRVDLSTALAFAIGSHAVAIAIHVALGTFGAWREGMSMARLSRIADPSVSSRPAAVQG
jgi:glycosyltransferase 2 family protein